MPPLPHDEEDGSDVDMPVKSAKPHIESNVEADVHAKDQLKDELMEDIEAQEGKRAAKAEKKRLSPTASNEEVNDDGDESGEEGSEAEDDEVYEVEAIRGHEFRRKGKGPYVLLYNVKWKGYGDEDNTLEPEENLISSRDLLARYHHSIGGAPQPPNLKGKPSKKTLRQDSAASANEDSPAPAAKRQKRQKSEDDIPSDLDPEEAKFGSWVPKSNSWEADVQAIETVERDQTSKDLYILLLFKNGKKSRVKNVVMRKKAPQKLLDFYEAHLSV